MPSQEDGSPLQAKPISVAQADEQPSPPATLPSSHGSVPRTRPSPQIGVQTDGLPPHVHPASVVQVAEQPSPALVLPSSQTSPITSPSPHMGGTTSDTGASPSGSPPGPFLKVVPPSDGT